MQSVEHKHDEFITLKTNRPEVNVLYGQHIDEGILRLARVMADDFDLNPEYVLVPPRHQETAEELLPEAILHENKKAFKGIPPAELASYGNQPLDKEILDKYEKHRYVIYKLMNRIDSGCDFRHDERERFFNTLIRYWHNALVGLEIDAAVFNNDPHNPANYAIYAVCKENNIDTLVICSTNLPNRYTIKTNIHDPPKCVRETYVNEYNELDVSEISDDITNYLDDKQEEYSRPSSVKIDYSNPFRTNLKHLASLVFHFITSKETTTYDKVKGRPIENQYIPLWKNIYREFKARLYLKQLKDHYQSLTTAVDIDKKYVYVPLHKQPELNTTPMGGVYSHLYLVIHLLSHCIPDGWSLYVKEHPNQFRSELAGNRGRIRQDYDDMVALDNVCFVNYSNDPYPLIDNSQAIATITGSTGWEALLRGTPIIAFGNAWYRCCEGVYYVESRTDLRQALEEIRHGDGVDGESVKKFIRTIEICGAKSSHFDSTDTDKLLNDGSIQNLSKALSTVLL